MTKDKENDTHIYRAWREFEAHQVPITEEAEYRMILRWNAYKAGWLEALEQQEVGDAEIKQMLNDIEWYQMRVKELEEELEALEKEIKKRSLEYTLTDIYFLNHIEKRLKVLGGKQND